MAQRKPIHSELAGVRETFESIWVAIILAFVLRAFVVEAFVIPTGSMAPHLMGAHVLLQCPDCGWQFPFGLSTDGAGRTARPADGGTGAHAFCPNCGEETPYNFPGGKSVAEAQVAPPKSGDRVLVLKYLYKFSQPSRWDVVVFKNPQTNRENYIKRLVGLPGEVVRIVHGDVFIATIQDTNGDGRRDELDLPHWPKPLSTDTGDLPWPNQFTVDSRDLDWRIARKDARTQDSVWQVIYDDDYRPAMGPRRDQPFVKDWASAGEPSAWKLRDDDGLYSHVFSYDGSREQSLRFAEGQRNIFLAENAYNDRTNTGQMDRERDICSDLKLAATLVPAGPEGTLRLELSNLNHQFAGEISFDGRLRIYHRLLDKSGRGISQWELWPGMEKTVAPFRAGRAVPIALTHADWKATLWIDGRPELETTDEFYSPDIQSIIDRLRLPEGEGIPTPQVSIGGSQGAFQLWHVQVLRDLYYTSPSMSQTSTGDRSLLDPALKYYGVGNFPGWGTMGNPLVIRAIGDDPNLDEFFMLGDNSPASLDSRLWVKAAPTLRNLSASDSPRYRLGTVPRYNLIGRAFFVYWPSGGPLPGQARLPLVPNVGKMRLIR